MINLLDTAQPHTQQGALSDSATSLVVGKVGVAARPVPPFVATSMQGGLITHQSESVLVTAIQDGGTTETWTVQRSYGDAPAQAHAAGTEWMPGTVTARDMMGAAAPVSLAGPFYPGRWYNPIAHYSTGVNGITMTRAGEPQQKLHYCIIPIDLTIDCMAMRIDTAGDPDGRFVLGIYDTDDHLMPRHLVLETGPVSGDIAGDIQVEIPPTTLRKGAYWLSIHMSTPFTNNEPRALTTQHIQNSAPHGLGQITAAFGSGSTSMSTGVAIDNNNPGLLPVIDREDLRPERWIPVMVLRRASSW